MHFVGAAVAGLADARARGCSPRAASPRNCSARRTLACRPRRSPRCGSRSRAELDDEFFGLDRRRMKVGSFALLCHAVLHAPDLGGALRRLLRGFAVVLDDLQRRAPGRGRDAVIRLDEPDRGPPRRGASRTRRSSSWSHGIVCWLAGRRIPLTLAEFAHPRPAHAQEYGVMYSQRLRFDAARTAIQFDARSWTRR